MNLGVCQHTIPKLVGFLCHFVSSTILWILFIYEKNIAVFSCTELPNKENKHEEVHMLTKVNRCLGSTSQPRLILFCDTRHWWRWWLPFVFQYLYQESRDSPFFQVENMQQNNDWLVLISMCICLLFCLHFQTLFSHVHPSIFLKRIFQFPQILSCLRQLSGY